MVRIMDELQGWSVRALQLASSTPSPALMPQQLAPMAQVQDSL